MVPSRRGVRETRFANDRLQAVGVELMTLRELRARVPEHLLFTAERVGFCAILVVTGGQGGHLVDFEHLALAAGDAVFVRPGQVQQWQPARALQADLLLIDPAVLQPAAPPSRGAATAASMLRLDDWPTRFAMDADAVGAWRSLTTLLRRELSRPAADGVSAAIVHQLLLGLLLCISRSATGQVAEATAQSLLVRRMQRELEAMLHARPSVAALAQRLHVSTSTLGRACSEVLGHSAKAAVDRRVALEAQRLLVHGSDTSVAIGELLGFSEPTNFVKFFRRCVGTTPEAFRQARRPG